MGDPTSIQIHGLIKYKSLEENNFFTSQQKIIIIKRMMEYLTRKDADHIALEVGKILQGNNNLANELFNEVSNRKILMRGAKNWSKRL